MFLQNQKQNSQSKTLNDVISMVKQSGLSPEQFVKQLVSSGKISQQDLQRAMNYANQNINKRR